VKSAIFLLALCCISFALIDPPVQEVDAHNRGIAPQGIQHQNFLNYSEKEPTLGDPTTFFYVEILTLTPSVNMSVTSKLHPELIWLVTESHNSTVTEGYDNGYCDKKIVRRHFDEMKPKNVVAFYTLDGLIQKVGNETLYNTANRTVVLADNETPITGHSEVPFKPSFLCAMMKFFSKYILGDMIALNCYEESLARASPYATGVYNFTVRNRTIVAPHLSVALQGEFTMDYTEDGLEEHMEDGECETNTWDGNGTITLAASDFASYEVQNDYMTIIPYLPGAFSLSGNTSEDVMYHASLLSTSSLYKYYSKMDGKTAGAYYICSFNVTEDGYGTQFILANLTNHAGLLPEDPESQNNYTDAHRILYLIQASGLRSPTEMNNLSYNYSRIYDIEEVFYNVSNGEHEALLEFYTWFGDYSAPSDIHVSSGTVLALQASAIGDTVVVACTLMSRDKPVAGQPVELRVDDQTLVAVTNGLGVCTATFDTGGSSGVVGEFKGTSELLPSSATYALFASKPMAMAADFSIGNFGLLLLLAGLFAFSFLSLARSFNPMGGGAFMGDAFGKFFPFARKPGQGKKMIRVKKGKELAISVAAAVATGGAGAAAVGKIAGDAAAKKAAAEAAKKKAAESLRKKMMRELIEKDGKKKAKGVARRPLARGKASARLDQDKKPSEISKLQKDPINYLNTPKSRLAQRREQKALYVDVPRQELRAEMAHVVGEKDGEPAKQLYLAEKKQTKISYDIPSERKWNLYCEVNRDPVFPNAEFTGVTLGEHHIKVSPYVADGSLAEVAVNGAHEGLHTESRIGYDKKIRHGSTTFSYDVRSICDGFVETEAHRSVQRNPDILPTVKDNAELTPIYGEYCKISEVLEGIVTRKEYLYAHAKGDVEHLEREFNKIASNSELTFHDIFGVDTNGEDVMPDADKLNVLRSIFETTHSKEEIHEMKTRLDAIDKGKPVPVKRLIE
jgi:hypothetical protein